MAIEFTPNYFTTSYQAAVTAIILRDYVPGSLPDYRWFHHQNGREESFKMAVKYGLTMSNGDLASAEAMAKTIWEDVTPGYLRDFIRECEYHLYHWADRTLLVCNTRNRYIHRLRNYTMYYDGIDFTVASRCPVIDPTKDRYINEVTWFNPGTYTKTQGWFQKADDFPNEVLIHAEYHSKLYDPLPWKDEFKPIDGHYAKMSVKFPGTVSFYENEQRRAIGRRLCMKPGRYLTKYYPHLDLQVIRAWAAKADNQAKLNFAATPEDIESVYLVGPTSCMAHPTTEYNGQEHPTAAYGNSDLQIAYIGDKDKKVSARAVVWPEKKLVGRIYGDWDRMIPLLKAEGYDIQNEKHPNDYYHRMDGARLRVIEDENNKGRLICPYIDGMSQAHVRDGWLVLGAYKYTRKDEPHYPHYEVQTDSGSCWQTDSHEVADLGERRTSSWVSYNCGYDGIHDEWVYDRVTVVTQLATRTRDQVVHPMGPHRSRSYYHCAWNDTYYYTAYIPYTVIDGDKIPTALLNEYKREKGMEVEEEKIAVNDTRSALDMYIKTVDFDTIRTVDIRPLSYDWMAPIRFTRTRTGDE